MERATATETGSHPFQKVMMDLTDCDESAQCERH